MIQVRHLAWQTGLLAVSWFFSLVALADVGTLSEYQRIFSTHLGYELQYKVYRPAATPDSDSLPSLYVTDGQAYLEQGKFKSALDTAISTGVIKPVLVVFLDSRNPDDLSENRRDTQFMCSTDFAAFFAGELVPTITKSHPVSESRDDRVILGLSFGALNSACFGLMLPDLFSGIAMQSPASGEHVEVVRGLYEKREALPLKMFLSVGTKNDNMRAVKKFQRTLKRKGYDLAYITVQQGHDWGNWAPLLDDVLLTFFARPEYNHPLAQ